MHSSHSASIDGEFVSFVSVFVYALFAYLGVELTGIVAAEAQNPRRNVPKAIKLTMYRIFVFYVVSIFLLGICFPFNDPALQAARRQSTSAVGSPFVVAINTAAIKVQPHIFKACVLAFVFSACNSGLYFGSRSLYGLAIDDKAPKIFDRTNRYGIPRHALALTTAFVSWLI